MVSVDHSLLSTVGLLLLGAGTSYGAIRLSKYLKKPVHVRRDGDRSKPTRHQRLEYERARKLFQLKKIVDAARILEAIGFKREAVQMLEDAGKLAEAAEMLERMKRPNRAGVLLARHGKWELAAKYFRAANMTLEVARCAREYGDFRTAGEQFAKALRFGDAAECWRLAADYENAAKNYVLADDQQRAREMYEKLFEINPDQFHKFQFSDGELNFLKREITKGSGPLSFIDVIAQNNRLIELMVDVLRFNNLDVAARCLLKIPASQLRELESKVKNEESLTQALQKALVLSGTHLEITKSSFASHNEIGPNDPTVIISPTKTDLVLATSKIDMSERLEALIPRIRFFAELSKDERMDLLHAAIFEHFQDGEIVVQAGEQPTGLVVVESGQLKVSEASAQEVRVDLESGECLGDTWVLLDELAPATYTATRGADVLIIPKDQVESALSKNPTLARKLYKGLSKQIRHEHLTAYNYKTISKAS